LKNYLIRNLASLSVVLNTLTGGSYRNTFSARCGYACYKLGRTWAKVAVAIIDGMFFFDDDHCRNEYKIEYPKSF
jgi:hypothetical protein